MSPYDPTTATLTLAHASLVELARLHAGVEPLDGASPELVTAGVIGPDGVDELAGTLARIAVAPMRAAVIERFAGAKQSPLFIGWVADGDATVSGPDDAGQVIVTGTQLRELPALVSRWTGLDDAVDVNDRTSVTTTTDVLDSLVNTERAPSTGDATVDAIAAGWRCSWRATGSWGEEAADVGLTVVDAGDLGVWRVKHPGRPGPETVEVTLVPITVATALAGLGDVVTGRHSPRPAPTRP